MDPITGAVMTGAAAGVAADVTLAQLPKVAPNLADALGLLDKKTSDLHEKLTAIEEHLHQMRLMNEKTQISDTREIHHLTKASPELIADRGYAHFIIFCPAALTVTITVDGLAWNASLAAGPNIVDAPGNSYIIIQNSDSNAAMDVNFIWTNREFGNPV